MAEKTRTHFSQIYLEKIAHKELISGAEINLKERVKCPDFCDLRGYMLRIHDPVGKVQDISITEFNGAENWVEMPVEEIPNKEGIYTWTAEFSTQEKDGILHQGSSDVYAFTFKPHAIYIAVWDVKSPIFASEVFSIKLGVKCSANCALAGKKVEITYHEGEIAGSGTLGDKPWPAASTALYWTELDLQAPGVEGKYAWQIRSEVFDLVLPHEEAIQTFGFRTVNAPEHIVKVTVVDIDTQIQVNNARVFLHPHTGITGNDGLVNIEVPKGNNNLYVSKKEYETFRTNVIVTSDVAIKVELSASPPELLEDS